MPGHGLLRSDICQMSATSTIGTLTRILVIAFAVLAASTVGLCVAADDEAAAKEPAPPEPLSLAYVPRDAFLIAAIRPPAFLNCPSMKPLEDYLVKHQSLPEKIGVPLSRIEQITAVYFFGKHDGIAFVFRLAQADDAAAMVKGLQPDPEERVYAGRKYVRQKPDGDKSGYCVFTDDRTIVATSNEEHMRRLIVAGKEGATNSKWGQEWSTEDKADMLAMANIKGLRGLALLEGQTSSFDFGFPAEFSPLFEASMALLSLRIDDAHVLVQLQLTSPSESGAKKLQSSMTSLIDLMQSGLSLQRSEISSDAEDKGASLLGLLDVVDGLLDNVKVHVNNNTSADATLWVTLDDAAIVVQKGVLAFAAEKK